MSVVTGEAGSDRAGVVAPASDSASPDPSLVEVPARAEGLQLIGKMRGSGYRDPPALVRRGDGQTLQLTPLLYLVLEAVDGHTTLEQIATTVSTRYGRVVSTDNVRTLVDSKLRPLGLLKRADGSDPEVKKSDPLLALRLRYAVTDPARTRRLTAPFARLFHPLLAVPVFAAFVGVSWWLLFDKGLASATYEAFHRPGMLLLIFAVTVLSAGFHEFGHAAAARYGGATPGMMGLGVYLVWPAFYTDVTDSYRLSRGGRVRTDLGGLYFNTIVAIGIVGIWWMTGYDALLLVVVTQILQMVRQLAPLVRFDGYHLLADVTGVPDLFCRIKPTLLGLLPWRWRRPESRALKPWARAVVTLWVLVVVPLLLSCLTLLVIALPRVLATAWASVRQEWAQLTVGWAEGYVLQVGAQLLSVVAVAFPIFAIAYILTRLVRRVTLTVWRRTRGKPAQRAVAGLTAAAIITGLVWAWWPNDDRYRQIQPYERGTLTDAISTGNTGPLGAPPVAATGLAAGQYGRVQVLWPTGSPIPTIDRPQLAMVLLPRAAASPIDRSTGVVDTGTDTTSGAASTPAWVFPFDRPLPPEEGDNHALAVNTTDGTVVYDIAFALVWAEDGPVLNTNEAYAFASCRDCAAVAVGFQVVLIVGQADIVVPQNLAAAVNYDCIRCLTHALASQLVLTLDGPLSTASMEALNKLWADIAAFGKNIDDIPLWQLQARLTEYKQRILTIIENDPASESTTSDEAASDTDTQEETSGASSSDSTRTGSNTGEDVGTDQSSTDPTEPEPSAENNPPEPTSSSGPSSQPTSTTSPQNTPTPTGSSSPDGTSTTD